MNPEMQWSLSSGAGYRSPRILDASLHLLHAHMAVPRCITKKCRTLWVHSQVFEPHP